MNQNKVTKILKALGTGIFKVVGLIFKAIFAWIRFSFRYLMAWTLLR